MTIQLTNDGGGDVETILERTADPVALANNGKIYTKDIATVTELFYQASDGTVSQLTPVAAPGDTPWLRTVADVRLDQGGDTEVTPFDDNSTTFGLQSTVALTRRWLGVITGSNGISTFNAAGDATRSSFFGYAGLGWGDGIGGAIDVGMQRNGVARIVVSSGDLAGAAGGLFPSVVTGVGAGTGLLGDVTLPWTSVTTRKNGLVVYNMPGDLNPLALHNGSGIALGPGGGGAIDVGLRRFTTDVLSVTDGSPVGSGSLVPNVDNLGTLGTSANRWASVDATGAAAVTSGFRTWDTGPNPTTQLSGSNAGGGFLTLGSGAATDVRLQRTAAVTLTLDDGASGSIEVLPFAGSIQTNFGSSVSIFNSFTGNLFNVWDNSGDAFASARLTSGAVQLGPNGGATAPDVYLQRSAATELTISNGAALGVDVIPPADNVGRLGTMARSWLELWAFTVTTGDVVFTDPGCPVCGQEFAEGDDLVMRVIKTSRAPDGGPLTRTVPCHHGCK